jgi:6-pyruvoyltetrahydropterin/6-carboxytetrahydropterin synthase
MKAGICRKYSFDAAHLLPCLPSSEAKQCGRLHGHTYQLEVHLHGVVNEYNGIHFDYYEIDRVVKPALELIDHRLLNDVEGLTKPTTENVAAWIWERIKPLLPTLRKVVLHEGLGASVTYRGEE